ncbi:MAG: DUF2905 domain-containing protein [Nitrospirota bacterium]|nr:DUF2905 domain-containing protein [Nitrospirota bacterium]
MLPSLGKTLIVIGILLAVVGLILTFAEKIPWLGRLPGDIVVKRENFTFYFPLATSIIISIVITLLFWLMGRR